MTATPYRVFNLLTGVTYVVVRHCKNEEEVKTYLKEEYKDAPPGTPIGGRMYLLPEEGWRFEKVEHHPDPHLLWKPSLS